MQARALVHAAQQQQQHLQQISSNLPPHLPSYSTASATAAAAGTSAAAGGTTAVAGGQAGHVTGIRGPREAAAGAGPEDAVKGRFKAAISTLWCSTWVN